MKISPLALVVLTLPMAAGFVRSGAWESSSSSLRMSSSDPSAMTSYLAKAHEEKLRAVKEAEQKKDAEIQELKQELEKLKGGALATAPSAAIDVNGESKEALVAKLTAYQQFMAKYIVEAQQQKMAAVKAAEAAIIKKYEEKMPMLKESAAPPVDTPANPLFEQRNAKVAAAGKAGKSRWGDMEVSRAAGGAVTPPPVMMPSASPPSAPAPLGSVPAEVAEADHGLRADGGVGGYTLAERVSMGAEVVNIGSSIVNGAAGSGLAPPSGSLFAKRNARVAAAAKAGKSRWGEMEVAKAEAGVDALPPSSGAPVVAVVPPEVEAADHGLRADGGVGGPTLAQRVNLGARLLES